MLVVPVILLLHDPAMQYLCRIYLERYSLTSGTDFVIEEMGEMAEEHISDDPEDFQFLVTDSWWNREELAAQFVERMKSRNSNLCAASFSSLGDLPGPYDCHIPRGDQGGYNLVKVVENFLTIHR